MQIISRKGSMENTGRSGQTEDGTGNAVPLLVCARENEVRIKKS